MPAEIINIEGLYFTRARQIRDRSRLMREAGRPKDALHLNAEARRLDTIAYCIQQKADALARAHLINGGHVAIRPSADAWQDWPRSRA